MTVSSTEEEGYEIDGHETIFSLCHFNVVGAGGWGDPWRVFLLHKLLGLRTRAVDKVCFTCESDFGGSGSVLTCE